MLLLLNTENVAIDIVTLQLKILKEALLLNIEILFGKSIGAKYGDRSVSIK